MSFTLPIYEFEKRDFDFFWADVLFSVPNEKGRDVSEETPLLQ